eukprot:SAG11_NODE_901_length_6623_cov_3.043225_4_plen_1047_part_00
MDHDRIRSRSERCIGTELVGLAMAERSLVEVVAAMVAELGLDASLRGKKAVDAAKKELGLEASGKLKDQIQEVCDQLGIKTGWGVPKDAAVKASAADIPALRDKAKTAARAGNNAEAADCYTACLSVAPDASLYLARAQCFGKLQQFPKMLEDALACTKLERESWKGWDTAGHAQMGLEDYSAAHESYMKALTFNPMNPGLSQSIAKASAMMRAGQTPVAHPGVEAVAPEPAPEVQDVKAAKAILAVGPSDDVLAAMKAMMEAAGAGATASFTEDGRFAADGKELANAYDGTTHTVKTARRYTTIERVELRAEPSSAGLVIGTLEGGKQIRASHLQADSNGAVHVCCLKAQYPESSKMAGISMQQVAAATVDGDKLAAGLEVGGQLLILNVAVGQSSPVPLELDWCADDGPEEAVEEVKQALCAAFRAANEASSDLPVEAQMSYTQIPVTGEEFQQLADWVISEMVIGAGTQALQSQAIEMNYAQQRSVAVVSRDGEVRVATCSFVGQSSSFVMRTLTQNLVGADPSGIQVDCHISQTLLSQMDEYVADGHISAKLYEAANISKWNDYLVSEKGFGWICMAADGLQLAEEFEAELDEKNGKPRLHSGERALAVESGKLLLPYASGLSSVADPGLVIITTQRLIYIPALPHLPVAIPLRRVEAISPICADGVSSSITLSLAHADVSKVEGEWRRYAPVPFTVAFEVDVAKKKKKDQQEFATKVTAFHFILQQAVDDNIAADPNFSPTSRARADAVPLISEALADPRCQDAVNGAGKWKSKTLNYASASNEDNAEATLKLAGSTIAEIAGIIAESPQYEAVKAIFASVPGLGADPLAASGGMHLIKPSGVSSEFVALTADALEIHKILRGADVPYELTARCPLSEIEDVNSWAGRMIGSKVAGKASMQVRTKAGDKYFLEPNDEDVATMNHWITTIKKSQVDSVAADSGEGTADAVAGSLTARMVRLLVEQFVLGEHLQLLTACGATVAQSVDAAIERAKSEPQESEIFGLADEAALLSASEWANAVSVLAPLHTSMLPLEMLEIFQR